MLRQAASKAASAAASAAAASRSRAQVAPRRALSRNDEYAAKYQPKVDRAAPGALFRADDYAFDDRGAAPWRTPKSHITDGQLQPAAPQGTTSPALHVNGRAGKDQSPYTSFTSNLAKAAAYGKQPTLLEVDPAEAAVVDQAAIQRDIDREPHPSLAEIARNVSQPGAPLWEPDTADHQAAARQLGLAHQPPFTLRERAKVNTARDEEALVQGSAPARVWHHIDARKLHPKLNLGTGPGQLNLAALGAAQGRDPRSLHPTGFRYPLDDHGIAYQERKAARRAEQEEIARELAEHDAERASGAAGKS